VLNLINYDINVQDSGFEFYANRSYDFAWWKYRTTGRADHQKYKLLAIHYLLSSTSPQL